MIGRRTLRRMAPRIALCVPQPHAVYRCNVTRIQDFPVDPLETPAGLMSRSRQLLVEHKDEGSAYGRGEGSARDELLDYMRKMVDSGEWSWAGIDQEALDAFAERYPNDDKLKILVELAEKNPTFADDELEKKGLGKFVPVSSEIVAEARRLLATGRGCIRACLPSVWKTWVHDNICTGMPNEQFDPVWGTIQSRLPGGAFADFQDDQFKAEITGIKDTVGGDASALCDAILKQWGRKISGSPNQPKAATGADPADPQVSLPTPTSADEFLQLADMASPCPLPYKPLMEHPLLQTKFPNRDDTMKAIYEGCGYLCGHRGSSNLDKKQTPLLATSGPSGAGKSELLHHLNRTEDSWVNGADTPLLQHLQGTPSPHCGVRIQHLLILFAGFNQATTFDDKDMPDVQRMTCLRFACSYFGIKKFHTLRTEPRVWAVPELATFEAFTAWIRNKVLRSFGARDITEEDLKKVAVLYCVDEVLKVKDYDADSYKKVLDSLATFEQSQLEQGFASFVLLTSLDLYTIAERIVTYTQRVYRTIPLPVLDDSNVEQFIMPIVRAIIDKLHQSNEAEQKKLRRAVEANIAMSGGHPGAIANVIDTLTQEATPGQPCTPVEEDDVRSALELLYSMLCGDPPTCDVTGTGRLPDQYTSMAKVAQIAVQPFSPSANRHVVQIRLIPYALLATPRPNMVNVIGAHIADAIVDLFTAMTKSDDEAQPHALESAVPCALYLRACALQARGMQEVSLADILPKSTTFRPWKTGLLRKFKELKDLKVHASVKDIPHRREVEGIQTRAQLGTARDAGAFCVHALNPVNESVEGCVNTADVPLLTQMKLYKEVSPGEMVKHITAVCDSFGKSSHVALYCCTGDAKGAIDGIDVEGAIVLGTVELDELLRPFGAFPLVYKIVENLRASQKK